MGGCVSVGDLHPIHQPPQAPTDDQQPCQHCQQLSSLFTPLVADNHELRLLVQRYNSSVQSSCLGIVAAACDECSC
jgi:hypothetical protein